MTDSADLAWFTEWVGEQSWTFAKTMKDAPHSYVVKGKDVSEEDFYRAVRVIRTFGEPGKFWSKTHIYLTVGDVKFWTMGAPVPQTKIINKAGAHEHYGLQDAPRTFTGVWDRWDLIATEYDEMYPYVEESKAVREAIVGLVGAFAPMTLDVGCGTGRPLDGGWVPYSMYTGIDSSQAMLNELVRKVNRAKKKMPTLISGRAEDVDFGTGYDLGLALFGSASEIEESVIDRMAACCSDLVLMPLHDGPNASLCRMIEGAVVRQVGSFDLVTVKG